MEQFAVALWNTEVLKIFARIITNVRIFYEYFSTTLYVKWNFTGRRVAA